MQILKKILKSFLIGTLAGLAIALITHNFVPELIDRLEYQSYYMRYYWKYMDLDGNDNNGASESGICIIDIDDRSQHKLGNYWNWNRSYHARLIRNLSSHYPAAIAFDINFYDPEDMNHRLRLQELLERTKKMSPDINLSDQLRRSIISCVDYDRQLIDATEKAGNVFHGVRMSERVDYPEHSLSQVDVRKTVAWHDSLHPQSSVTIDASKRKKIVNKKEYIDGIFPGIAKASRGIGHLNITPNSDGVIREIPLLFGFGSKKPVVLPISLRTVATLFATPNEEIVFEPEKYLDIGHPFKIFKDKSNRLSISYPHVSPSQVRAIVDAGEQILSLKPDQAITITGYAALGRDDSGNVYLSLHAGDLPTPVLDALRATSLSGVSEMEVGAEKTLAPDVSIMRDSELDWVLMAPYGYEEWWLSRQDLRTIQSIGDDEYESLKNGQRKLIFQTFTVRNKDGELFSSIPVLRGKTLRQLCKTSWAQISEIDPGSRMNFGDRVQIPLTQTNRHIITYFGPKGKPFRYYSYVDIMNDRIRGNLEGKIFLVGSTVPNMFDIVSVPLYHVYPGVEVHASMMHSFLTNQFVKRLSGWQDFLILLLVGVVIGVIAILLRPLFSAILTVVAIFGYFLLAMTLFGTDNLWIEMARPAMTILLTYTAVMAYRYMTEEKDRKYLQSTFKQYLSPELIDMMYQERKMPKLGGDEGIRTAYFTDIQSFSTFSEKLGSPTRLVELLNEYLTAMTDILLAHYGTLDKYEGDAIIAFFGAPMPMQDHALQACNTAIRMQQRLGELRKKWESEGDKWPRIVHDMRMRIGINTGAITTGNMGSAVRMNYTMMGDAVNLAARLESAAKQYGVYTMISEATYEMVKDYFEARLLDKIAVVGKSQPVMVYELIAERGGLNSRQEKLISTYREGLDYFYAQQWDKAIEKMRQSEQLEPHSNSTPGGMSPSRKIIQYCDRFKLQPPGSQWDGVIRLTSK
ncbi:MAG: CHASE2 domain-containing protein [Fibrobacterota bacterium]